MRARCATVELHHLPSGEVLRWEHTEKGLQRHVTRAESLAAEIVAATDYPERPSSLCAWCDFVRVCPAGMAAAGAPKEPWAGLAPEIVSLEEDPALDTA